MVGAGSSTAPHSRLSFSCHGSRIDCYGWGENIDTTGDGWQGNATDTYTMGFGGTSGASPMVAGAAVLLQSWRKHRKGSGYSPETLRDMLRSSLNTASANPASDRIGVMPNLRAIIETAVDNENKFAPNLELHHSLVYILFGLVDDGPGMIWIPGKGPVPVDPDWGVFVRTIPAPKRDLFAALAMNELAGLIEDQPDRTRLADASIDAMRGAVDRISRMR